MNYIALLLPVYRVMAEYCCKIMAVPISCVNVLLGFACGAGASRGAPEESTQRHETREGAAMPLISTLGTTLATILLAVVVLWLVSLARRDASIADPFWGFGFVVVAWIAWLAGSASTRGGLLVALTTAWGMRLCLFLLFRNGRHREDRRYAAMRAQHGKRFWWVSLVTVFLLQGGILWFVSWPLQAGSADSSQAPLGPLDALGVALYAVGLFFEAVGDWQLARFKADPSNVGRVMDRGLWRYTRHPNYFGDCCVWWGIYLVAAAGGAFWTIASPLVMTWLLLRVSGVALLERDIADRRPEYAAYRARTNAFFPGPPRKAGQP